MNPTLAFLIEFGNNFWKSGKTNEKEKQVQNLNLPSRYSIVKQLKKKILTLHHKFLSSPITSIEPKREGGESKTMRVIAWKNYTGTVCLSYFTYPAPRASLLEIETELLLILITVFPLNSLVIIMRCVRSFKITDESK